jgi:hypothetical protein
LNNHSLGFIIPDSVISTDRRWQSVICSVNVAARKIVTFVNNARVADIDLPAGFQFEVIGTASENTDKLFTFTDYSVGSVFYGYADNIKVWGRALTPSEIDFMINNPALTIQKAVIVSWPSFPSWFSLECAPSINGPYQLYTGSTYQESTLYKAAVPLTGSQKFFRLVERPH